MGYIYAHNNPKFADRNKYKVFAESYIKAIKKNNIGPPYRLTPRASLPGSPYLMGDGYNNGTTSWHPDYSSLRAFELFINYDTDAGAEDFWDTCIFNLVNIYKAIFKFGANPAVPDDNVLLGINNSAANATFDRRQRATDDGRFQEPTGQINNESYNIQLPNPTFTQLDKNSSQYVAPNPLQPPLAQDNTLPNWDNNILKCVRTALEYNTDCQRLPIRLANYLNQEFASTGNTLYPEIINIAAYMTQALEIAYLNGGPNLNDKIDDILYPDYTPTQTFNQNFTCSGAVALATNNFFEQTLDQPDKIGNALRSSLLPKFANYETASPNPGNNIPTNLANADGEKNGYNAAFTLLGLTMTPEGATDTMKLINKLERKVPASS